MTYDAFGNPAICRIAEEPSVSYDYDSVGRMTGLTDQAGTETTFVIDPRNLLLTRTDGLGNQTATYAYDAAGRLTGLHNFNNTVTSFVYDGAGNRIAATRNGSTVRYIYDPASNLLATADENNTILSYFVHGQGFLAMVTPDNQTYCYHFDGTGNTVAMTDSSQYSANSYAYTPFGMIIGENETVDQPFKYVGQFGVMAEPDNLYYMKARYYDADTGRFISEDPIGFEGGINLYAYCLNNPILLIDPLGLCAEPDSTYPVPINPYSSIGAFATFAIGFSDHIKNEAWATGNTPNFIESSVAGAAKLYNARNNYGTGQVKINPLHYNNNKKWEYIFSLP
jgi:RHS repeat-associated protein